MHRYDRDIDIDDKTRLYCYIFCTNLCLLNVVKITKYNAFTEEHIAGQKFSVAFVLGNEMERHDKLHENVLVLLLS